MIVSVGGGLVVATALVERIMLHTGITSNSIYASMFPYIHFDTLLLANEASISGNNRNNYENTGLYTCLRDNEGYTLFERFCVSEQSAENLHCWVI